MLLRVLRGLAGSRYACFRQFVRALRHLGRNPLGGWMVVGLPGCVAGLAFTGWRHRTDAFLGNEVVEDAHRMLAWARLGAAVLRVSGAVFNSLRHRENLLTSMFSGSKRAASGSDNDSALRALAARTVRAH